MRSRLCIYVVYDKDGVIDDYIPYFLNALKPFVTHMAIVCNGKLNGEGRKKLSQFTSDLFVRENTGYDAGAVKDVLRNLYGWDKVLEYDELLIANDTFYAPLYPLDECFGKMDGADVDFWGWLVHAEHISDNVYVPEHVQSYFLNVKRRLLHSDDFREFWETLATAVNPYEAIRSYEVNFTQAFSQKGYTYDAYLKSENNHPTNLELNINPFIYEAVNLVASQRAPFIKKKALQRMFLDVDIKQYETRKAQLLSLAEGAGYDTNLITGNLDRIGMPAFTELKPKDIWIGFARQTETLYIYGAGTYADMAAHTLDKNNIDYIAFIVTDGLPKHDVFHGHPCLYLSEIEFKDSCGVILALDSRNRVQVEPLLKERGIQNYITV